MKTLQAVLLLIVAIVLSVLLLPLAFLFEIIFTDNRAKYLYKVARSIDQTANAVGGIFFSLLFVNLHTGGYTLFGNEDETISSVLGKNERAGTLGLIGLLLDKLLNMLDPGHSIDAIEDDE